MRKFYLLLISCCFFSIVRAQFNINAVSTNYSENFDALTSGTWTDNTSVTGWYVKTDNTASPPTVQIPVQPPQQDYMLLAYWE